MTQAEWAELGGVGLGAQHRYETGSSEPNASYFAGLYLAGMDVLYLITGTPSGDALDARTQALVIRFQQLPPAMQDAVAISIEAIGRAALDLPVDPAAAGVTLHDQRRDYRSDPDQH